MKSRSLIFVVSLFAFGCGENNTEKIDQPRRSMATTPRAPDKGVRPTPPIRLPPEDVARQTAAESLDMFLMLPQKEEFAALRITNAVLEATSQALDKRPPLKLETTGGDWFLQVTAAPVEDVEEFAQRQKLGRVLAIDPDKRRLLIEYAASAAPRDTWKDAAYLERQVTALSARWGQSPFKEHPEQQTVYVRLRGDWSQEAAVAQANLRAILEGPEEKRRVRALSANPLSGDWSTTMAPVSDLEALVKKIDFADVVFYDTQNRALVLERRE